MAGWDVHSSTAISLPVSVSVLCPHTLPLTTPQCHIPHSHRLSSWAHPLATVLTERSEVRFVFSALHIVYLYRIMSGLSPCVCCRLSCTNTPTLALRPYIKETYVLGGR